MNNQKLSIDDLLVAGNKTNLNSEIVLHLSCEEIGQLILRIKRQEDISPVEFNSIIFHLSNCTKSHAEYLG